MMIGAVEPGSLLQVLHGAPHRFQQHYTGHCLLSLFRIRIGIVHLKAGPDPGPPQVLFRSGSESPWEYKYKQELFSPKNYNVCAKLGFHDLKIVKSNKKYSRKK